MSWRFDVEASVHSVMVAVHSGLAVGIVVGGTTRFAASYDTLLQISHGMAWPWGMAIGVSAILMVMHNVLCDLLGLFIGVVWMNLWMAGFFVEVAQSPTAVATAGVAYAGFGAINAVLMANRLVVWKKVRELNKPEV